MGDGPEVVFTKCPIHPWSSWWTRNYLRNYLTMPTTKSIRNTIKILSSGWISAQSGALRRNADVLLTILQWSKQTLYATADMIGALNAVEELTDPYLAMFYKNGWTRVILAVMLTNNGLSLIRNPVRNVNLMLRKMEDACIWPVLSAGMNSAGCAWEII